MKRLFLTACLLGSALTLSSCGVVNHQIYRAVNLLKVPVRVSQKAPSLDGADHLVRHLA